MITDKRKHYSQMTQGELDAVLLAVRSNVNFELLPHAKERMVQKNIPIGAVASAIVKGSVIEVHNNNLNDIRVLLVNVVNNRRCNVVVGLKSRKVITTFWNSLNDTHETLDKSQYKWAVDLKTVVK